MNSVQKLNEPSYTPQMQVQRDESEVLFFQASQLFKSGLLPKSLNSVQKVFAITMMGKEMGLKPFQSMAGIDVIFGMPVVKPKMMLALINMSSQKEYVNIDSKNDYCKVTMKRKDNAHPYTSIFTVAMAKEVGLFERERTLWGKYTKNLLKWRAVKYCADEAFPEITMGLILPDEAQEIYYSNNEDSNFHEDDNNNSFQDYQEGVIDTDFKKVEPSEPKNKNLYNYKKMYSEEKKQEEPKKTEQPIEKAEPVQPTEMITNEQKSKIFATLNERFKPFCVISKQSDLSRNFARKNIHTAFQFDRKIEDVSTKDLTKEEASTFISDIIDLDYDSLQHYVEDHEEKMVRDLIWSKNQKVFDSMVDRVNVFDPKLSEQIMIEHSTALASNDDEKIQQSYGKNFLVLYEKIKENHYKK